MAEQTKTNTRLTLYRINYRPHVFSLILACSEDAALKAWQDHDATPRNAAQYFESIREISRDEFYDGSVLINHTGDA